MCGCLSHSPYWGPGPQPRHVPWVGIKLLTLWFVGRHSTTEPQQPGWVLIALTEMRMEVIQNTHITGHLVRMIKNDRAAAVTSQSRFTMLIHIAADNPLATVTDSWSWKGPSKTSYSFCLYPVLALCSELYQTWQEHNRSGCPSSPPSPPCEAHSQHPPCCHCFLWVISCLDRYDSL